MADLKKKKPVQAPLKEIHVRPGAEGKKERPQIATIVSQALKDCREAAYQGRRVKYGRSLLENATMVAVTIIIPDVPKQKKAIINQEGGIQAPKADRPLIKPPPPSNPISRPKKEK